MLGLAAEISRSDNKAEQARKTAQARLSSPGAGASSTAETETFNISPEECVRRLRLKSQPIRLFGETDKDRRLRLRALELLEERGEGTQNDFKRTLEHLEMSLEEKNLGKAARLTHASAGGGGEMNAPTVKETKGKAVAPAAGSVIDLNLLKDDPNKLYPLIYFALKVGCQSVRCYWALTPGCDERMGRMDGCETRRSQAVRTGKDGSRDAGVVCLKSQAVV